MRGMMLRYKANFASGLTRPVNDQVKFDERMVVKCLRQSTASVVITNDADENATHAKRNKIARDVAGPTDHQLSAFNGDDWRRRLGRDTRNFAVDKLVQHQIADAKHGLLGQGGKMLVKIVHGPTGSD